MLKVHFLNVGHGDSTLIEHPSGRLTLIDINNSQEPDQETIEEYASEKPANPFQSLLGNTLNLEEAKADAARDLTDPIAYIKAHYPGRKLFRFILTHPDLDHMRGIERLHSEIGFTNFWDIDHTKAKPSFRGSADRTDWAYYQKLRSGALGVESRQFYRAHKGYALNRDENGNGVGDNIDILSPTKDLVQWCNQTEKSNDLSYVLSVAHAGNVVLLPGDAEKTSWDRIVEHYGDKLKSTVLKASHHGRDTGFHLEALKAIAPRVVVVSVGKKPETDASPKYRYHGAKVWSTRYYGNIVLEVNDAGKRNWIVDRNADT